MSWPVPIAPAMPEQQAGTHHEKDVVKNRAWNLVPVCPDRHTYAAIFFS